LFVNEGELLRTAQAEQVIPFDAPKISEVRLNRRGNRCSFEAIIDDYNLEARGLARLALIVRTADVKGQESVAAEGLGLRAIAEGFAAINFSDEERLARGFRSTMRSTHALPVWEDSGAVSAQLAPDLCSGFLRSLGIGLYGTVLVAGQVQP
jgi:hypothetical protein